MADLLTGDCRDALDAVPDGTFDMVVSSPPYYGSVRTYGALEWFATEGEAQAWAERTAGEWNEEYGTVRVTYVAYAPTHVKRRKKQPWASQVVPLSVWGGDLGCEHVWGEEQPRVGNAVRDGLDSSTLDGMQPHNIGKRVGANVASGGRYCQRCGAWLGQLGQEPTPGEYLAHIGEIASLLLRKVIATGTCFWNIGDCYAGTGTGKGTGNFANVDSPACMKGSSSREAGRRDGEPLGIPHRTVEAFRAAAWWHRSEIVWAKAVEARGVEATLFGDEAVDRSRGSCMPAPMAGWRWERHKIKVKAGGIARRGDAAVEGNVGLSDFRAAGLAQWATCPGCPKCEAAGGYILRRGRYRPVTAHEFIHLFSASRHYYGDGEGVKGLSSQPTGEPFTAGAQHKQEGLGRENTGTLGSNYGNSRNLRDVWEIGAEPLKENHFAAFPTELPRRCIRIGTPDAGVCAECGSPWARVIERGDADRAHQQACGGDADGAYRGSGKEAAPREQTAGDVKARVLAGMRHTTTHGWRATCSCGAPTRPARVLDPFGGSGRTAEAAASLGRDWTLCEIVPAYAAMARRRLLGSDDCGPLFAKEQVHG